MDRNLEQYFSEYSKLPFENIQESYRKRKILDWINGRSLKGMNILEVGCGQDSIFNYLDNEGSRYIIDPIQEMFESKQNKKLNIEINRYVDTLENVHLYIDIKFDVVIVSSLIHEINNPIDFLFCCKKLLKKEGKIIVVTNNKASIHRILGVELGILKSTNSRTQTEDKMQQIYGAFTMSELVSLFEKCDLNVSRIETFFPKLLPHKKMSEAIESKVINSTFLDQLDALIEYLPDFGSEIIAEISHDKKV